MSMDTSSHNKNTTYLTWKPVLDGEDGSVDNKNMVFSSYITVSNPINDIVNEETDFIFDFSSKEESNNYNRGNSSFIWKTSSITDKNNTSDNNDSFLFDLSTQKNNENIGSRNMSFILKDNTSVPDNNDNDIYVDCDLETPIPNDISSTNVEKINGTSTSLHDTKHKVALLILRQREKSEEFLIKVAFDSKTKFTFNIDEKLTEENSQVTLVYRIDLDVKRSKNGELSVLHKNQWISIRTYQLYSTRTILMQTMHYNDVKSRTICNSLNTTLNFIFDAHFSSGYRTSAGGSNVPFWNQLCLFTYYLVRRQDYASVDTLIDQFKCILQSDNRQLTRDEFKGFFQNCSTYFASILKDLTNKSELIKYLVLIIGLLPIRRKNIDLNCCVTQNVILIIFQHVSDNFDNLLESVTPTEWVLFSEGFATLLCIQLSIQEPVPDHSKGQINDTFALLLRIPVKKQYQVMADSILTRLEDLQKTLSASKWTELLLRISPDRFTFNILEKTKSFEIYFSCLTQTSEICIEVHGFREKLKLDFEDRVYNDFEIDLESIRFLLEFLTQPILNKNKDIADHHQTIRWIVETNVTLRRKISSYLSNLKIEPNNMKKIRDIFRFPCLTMVCNVDPHDFLSKSLSNKGLLHSFDFYIEWFQCFLVPDQQLNSTIYNNSLHEYEKLLKVWALPVAHSSVMFLQLLKNLDQLITAFAHINNDRYRSSFINHINDLCFQQKSISSILNEGLITTGEQLFLKPFKTKFAALYFNRPSATLKDMRNPENPLYYLIEHDKRQQGKNLLVRDLIHMAIDNIEISAEEILQDTFHRPNRSSFTYLVLFEDCFQTSKLRQKTVDRLLIQLNAWEEQGLRANEIHQWNNYTNDQCEIARRIWNCICKVAEKPYEIEILVHRQETEMNNKLELVDNVVSCLDAYCQDACDKPVYDNHLEIVQKQLGEKVLRLVQIPAELDTLLPFAKLLNPITGSHAWRTFLEQHNKNDRSSLLQSELPETEVVDNNLWIFDRDRPTTAENLNETISTSVTTDTASKATPKSCLVTLKKATEIRELFNTELKRLCLEWTELPISHLIKLFPDMQLANQDLHALALLLDHAVIPDLKKLIDYWQIHERIAHIRQGSVNILSHLQGQIIDEPSSSSKTTLDITEKASGATCYEAYENYCINYSQRYSDQALRFIAQYSSSAELLAFLHSLNENEGDSLLEAVNDFDETLTDTKTMVDFATLKTFTDRVYANIKRAKKQTTAIPLSLEDVVTGFQSLINEPEFKNILDCFEPCSKSLESIKRIHADSTNKGQSKRRRIFDIMLKSSFAFVHESIDDRFDVHSQEQSMRYDDLSELRDRARLIEYSNNKIKSETNKEIEELHMFVTLVDTIDTILNTLTSLYMAGHPSIPEFMAPRKIFTCDKGDYHDLVEFNSMLDQLLERWENNLCTMYKQYIDLTYFSRQQIWTIENLLYNQTVESTTHGGYHLIKFIGIEPRAIQTQFLPERSEEPMVRLENVSRILTTQRRISNVTVLPKSDDRFSKPVYLVETTDEGILRAILSLFRFSEESPRVNHLFYCTNNTSWFEMRAFIYRCFYSQTLQQLIRPELLSPLIQDRFTRLLNELFTSKPKRNFRMGIVTTSQTGHWQLLNGLRTLQIVYSVHDQEMLDKEELEKTIQGLLGNNDTCVTSKISGLGKSTFVLDEILRMNKHYIKFPIGGEISADTLAERLRNQGTQLASSTAALHIDIGTIENVRQLNELLYCLLLFRSFRFGQEAIHVPHDVPIYIELDASLHTSNLQEKMVILNYLKKKHLNSIDLNSLKVNAWPEIHGVVAYLRAIKNGEISRRNISQEQLEDELRKKRADVNTCFEVLQEHFIQNQNIEFITWTKLSIFIAIYYKLFLGFSRCGHFLVEFMQRSQLRVNILQTLLQSSDQFTSVSVEAVRNSQRSVNESNVSLSDAVVRWDTTKPFTVVFTDTDDPLFIYKKVQDVPRSLVVEFDSYKRIIQSTDQQSLLPDYDTLTHVQFFLKLVTLSKKYFSKTICRNCFNQYEHNVEQCSECKTPGTLLQPAKASTRDIETILEKMGRKLETTYVLTPDNYIKMLLIYLRVQSGVPVLIMGETGCGKTSLIQFLCQRILDDEMTVFRIHAGVTSGQIITEMRGFIEMALACSQNGQNKRLWVFLDEFNTTPSIGLFKEIVCERTLLGEPLPKNMVLLGACNPQRRKNDNIAIDDNIGIKKERYEMQRVARDGNNALLLYSVVPIPETMLEYVWDYGFLDEITETKYIRTMLKRCVKLEAADNWFGYLISLISKSQQYFREHEDVSSVSLRDVARFCNLYNWFHESILIREGEQTFADNPFVVIWRASLMALLLCYYFRLRSPSQRRDYINLIENILKPIVTKQAATSNFLIDILRREQLKLVDGMELPSGTAKNQALIDNIFVLLVCIVNRIPVILCGKPGCSKTSAIQIVISNMKGKRSEQVYFRTLPELIAVSYQGSQNCTSESIINVFQRAKKYLKAKSATELLPVVVFDEIGLAELSPHNPLKVLHSELEVDACQHAFVGLSNWRLDASKMNRALYAACADPDIDDLQNTATTIMSSMFDGKSQVVRLDKSILKGLATAYFDLYEQINLDQQYNNYFGLRDFYSLIKGVVRDSVETKEQDRYESIRRQLKINFDGIFDGAEFMWQRFCHNITRQYLTTQYFSPIFKQLLDRSLSSRTGRYLMLIGENERAIDYVERYIIAKYQTPPVRTLIGSSLSGDLVSGTTYTEQYNYRLLMDIILHAETNVTLVMRQMGHLYESLYDLFNQSFAISARKKYCRIALGAFYHPRCLVHDDFYCVVFIRQQDLAKCDPPFLNRFEKHLIDIDSLIHERHATLTRKFLAWLAELLPTDGNKHFPLLQHLFVDYSNEYICNLVMDAFDYLNISVDNNSDDHTDAVMSFCKDKFLLTSSSDLLFVTSIRSNKDNIHPLIEQYYKVHMNLSFLSIIDQELNETMISNRIVYTYTQLYHVIDCVKNDHRIDEVKLSDFKTELELIKKIKKHYNSTVDTVRLLLIRVDYHREHHHILMLKHILLNERLSNTNRGIWLVFHLERNMLNQTTNDVLFNGWSTVMIDNINDLKIIPRSILLNPSYYDLIAHPQYVLSENMFDELFDWCLTKLRYTVARPDDNRVINDHRDRLIKFVVRTKTDSLRSIIRKHLARLIQTSINHPDSSRFIDWRYDLLTNGVTIGSSRSCDDAVQMTVALFYRTYLLLLLGHLEKYTFIDSYSFLVSETTIDASKQLHELWHERLNTTLETIDFSLMNMDVIQIPLVSDLRLPCAQHEYEIIRRIRQTMAQRVQKEEMGLDQFYRSAIEQLRHRSAYGKNIEMILNNEILFNHYYHDQLALVQDETKIYQLSTTFIRTLLSTNSIRTITQRLNHLFIDYEELLEFLRLFEIGVQLIGDENQLKFDQQFIDFDQEQFPSNNNDSDLYCLILTNGKFYLIPPRTSITVEEEFTCDGDPWIETSLMNLIELLISQSVIASVQNIEQLTSVYGQIAQGILELSSYPVNNLEKLRSFTSLLRCITALLPSDRALEAFKIACFYGKFDAAFTSCEAIHSFIDYLHKTINGHQPTASPTVIRQNLLKLEMEFVKNWLVDHSDQYDEVLKLIDQSNDMWQYSAKIFFYIERKLDLLSTVRNNHGRIPEIDDLASLNRCLQETNDSTRKIERLIINRLHMNLVLGASELETIEQILTNDFEQVENNIRLVQNDQSQSSLLLICLISWLKYYAQLYAFALNHDSHNEIMPRLDRIFTSNESTFCSTLKLFVIKQLCQMSKVNLHGLRDIFVNRNLIWIRSLISESSNQDDAQNNLILPTPLFECRTEFEHVHSILINNEQIAAWQQLIVQCSSQQKFAYSFIIWFIHQYAYFYTMNTLPDKRLIQIIEHDLNQELNECFTPIGYKFLVSLCTNFKENSYFRLCSTMNNDDVHRRLVALNIVAVLISCKALGRNSYLGNLLFNSDQKMPKNYTEHVQTKICLPAFLPNDPFITQMLDVRSQVQLRLTRISLSKRFIYQCSQDCPWMFYFENCGDPNDRRLCPICKKEIGAIRDGVLIQRDPPQLKIPIDDGFQFITKYIEDYNRKICFGYHDRTPAEQSNTGEKPDYLQHSISYRFIHMFIHATLLLLNELDYLPEFDLPKHEHFREHFEKDYTLLGEQLNDGEQCYLWLFKLFNHLLDEQFIQEGLLDNHEKVVELETCLEKQLIFAHMDSIAEEIRQYKIAYMDFLRQCDEKFSMENYVDELVKNEQRFPLLHYFNVTNIHTANPMNEFSSKLRILPYGNETYPITTFLLKKMDDYANIRYLYPMVAFTSHLIQKFDYRIKRNDALAKTISDYLNQGSDSEITMELYKQFVDAWYKITLKEVRYRCQTAKVEHNSPQDEFAKNTKFAMVLLNTSKDESGILLAACLNTMGELQNEIVHFFHDKIIGNAGNTRRQRAIPIQSIRAEHVLNLTANDISLKLITDGFTINYQYGMGKDIIYDYEEIELTLCNMISRLPLIDTEKMNYFNYQFELYGENSSLITDVRARVKQELLTDDERTKLRGYISDMSNEAILHYLGSLDYVFTYLGTITDEFGPDPPSIQAFVQTYISSTACLNENVLRRQPFSTISLKYIIDLYELLEERAFDQVLRPYVKQELCEETFPLNERTRLIDVFIDSTSNNKEIAICFQNLACWIAILKRIMVRVLSSVSVHLDVPLNLYLGRHDLWTGDITIADIQSIIVSDDILLQHTFVILKGLEMRRDRLLSGTTQTGIDRQKTGANELQTSQGQIHQATTWHVTDNKNGNVPKVIGTGKGSGKKLR